MIPALQDASKDKALRGAPIVVYLELVYELRPDQYLPVKQAALAKKLEFSDRAIRRALKLLCDRRYLDREKSETGGPVAYRLVYRRTPGVALEHVP